MSEQLIVLPSEHFLTARSQRRVCFMVLLQFINCAAWGRGAALVLHAVYLFIYSFSFVGDQTKTPLGQVLVG